VTSEITTALLGTSGKQGILRRNIPSRYSPLADLNGFSELRVALGRFNQFASLDQKLR
jgi:hypothetical protein